MKCVFLTSTSVIFFSCFLISKLTSLIFANVLSLCVSSKLRANCFPHNTQGLVNTSGVKATRVQGTDKSPHNKSATFLHSVSMQVNNKISLFFLICFFFNIIQIETELNRSVSVKSNSNRNLAECKFCNFKNNFPMINIVLLTQKPQSQF